MSDLPQPIYPTPGSGSDERASARPYGANPSGPPPDTPPTWSVGPSGGPGGGPPSGPKITTQMVLAVAGVVVAVVAAGIYVANRPDPKKGPTTRPPGASAPAVNGGAGAGDGDGQVQARVEKVTAGLFEAQPAASSVTCVKQGLAQDPALLAAIEPTAPDVLLQSADDAGRYGALLAGCLSPEELNEELAQSLTELLDQPSLSCIRSTFASYRSEDWAPFVTAVVQSSRASEVESLLNQALKACGLAS